MEHIFTKSFEQNRRDFLKTSALAAGGLIIGFHIPGSEKAIGAPPTAPAKSSPPNAFIQIAKDNSITITINKLEMGQGVNTSMAQLIAEELECDWASIKSVSAPVNPVYNHIIFPMQMTGGSTALITTYDQYRIIGANMREMLLQTAATKWGVPKSSCRAEKGTVVHATKGKISYGELVEAASKLPLPQKVQLKKPQDFKVIGKSVTRVDATDKITGKGVFGIDVRIPDMQYAVVARPPVIGAKIKSLKDGAAKDVPGVIDIVRFGESVAVFGKNTWVARKGRDALEITWDFGGKDQFSSASIMTDFKNEGKKDGLLVEKRGAGAAALKSAKTVKTFEYEFPYLAHAPMEPMNCTIHYDGDKAQIWAGHQMPTLDRDTAAAVLGLPKEKVELSTVYAGGSFGRRANKNCDYTFEAASLAKVYKKPFKIVWTREDDMRGGYYRPMTYHKADLGFDAKNRLTAWNHRIVGQSVVANSPLEARIVKDGIEATVIEGVGQTPYDLKNFFLDLHRPSPNVTTLWWRSVGHTHTGFVMETLIDEIAHHTKQDALQMRRRMLYKSPRHVAVLDLLKRYSGWGKALSKGHAHGLAVHESFNSVVGYVVDVTYDNEEIKIHKVTAAVHCGQVVNPEGAKSQIESAFVFGLSAALEGEIKIEQGQVVNSNFHDYPVARITQMPKIDVYFVDSHDHPTGLGEPGVPPTAPAIANALFKLTGKRIRKMPFSRGMKEA